MEAPADIPTDPAERRRLQNRVAQRKWRRKRDEQRAAAKLNVDDHPSHDLDAPRPHAILPHDPSITAYSATPDPCLLSTACQPDTLVQGNSSIGVEELNLDGIDFLGLLDSDIAIESQAAPDSTSIPHFIPHPCPPTNMGSQGNNKSQETEKQRQYPGKRKPYHHICNRAQHSMFRKPSDPEGWLSPLHIAAQQGHEGVVRALLLRSRTDPNGRDSEGRTPLMHAIIEGHSRTVAALVTRGALIGHGDPDEHNALHYAAWYGHEEVLRVLLQACAPDGPEINACGSTGWTPLHIATAWGFEAGVLMLLDFGADSSRVAPKCPHFLDPYNGERDDDS
ncbi:hypothetical protein AK830_g8896 [Neonectria ditissima]|uniref:BZIP domain-containing protein n=1 Tax=Neonectria ditissima TaxID=78410 RepID=A0A0P7BDD1_9HYPO|nr:hypothetical protein AK830_g8896 [Neonectria ditissima]